MIKKLLGRKKVEKVPRECIQEYFDEPPRACPRCSGKVVNEKETYLAADRSYTYILHTDVGWFCLACPTAVIDLNQLEELMDLAYGSPECWLVGILDLDDQTGGAGDEIVKDDYGQPIGKLVPFLYDGQPLRKVERQPRAGRGQMKKRPKRKGRR